MTRLGVLVLVALLVGCPEESPAAMDAGTVERRTYVVADMSQPLNAHSGLSLGTDIDGDGTVDNQIANVFAALSAASQNGFDFQYNLDQHIAQGETIVLVELLAPSFVRATSARARLLRGEMPMPAPCDGDTDLICHRHLDGTGSFAVTAPAPELAPLSIDATYLDAGPLETTIPITFFGPAFWVPLVGAHVHGTISTGMIATGKITGGIRAADIDTVLIPGIHAGIAAQVVADCPGGTCEAGSSGEELVGIFDDNGDVVVSIDEFRTTEFIMTLLRPDADVFDANGAPGTDGIEDVLTLGLGFRAVRGSFPEQ